MGRLFILPQEGESYRKLKDLWESSFFSGGFAWRPGSERRNGAGGRGTVLGKGRPGTASNPAVRGWASGRVEKGVGRKSQASHHSRGLFLGRLAGLSLGRPSSEIGPETDFGFQRAF